MFKPQRRQQEKRPRINNFIRVPQLTVIDDQGNQLGIMSTDEALKLAQSKELDLVEIGPNTQPPIAKIMDYGKYMYQKEKRSKDGAKTKGQEIKIVQIGFKTGQHDLIIRAEQADKFLEKGHRVKIDLRLRGREKGMRDLASQKLKEFLTLITQPYTNEEGTKSSPNGFSSTIRPDTKK